MLACKRTRRRLGQCSLNVDLKISNFNMGISPGRAALWILEICGCMTIVGFRFVVFSDSRIHELAPLQVVVSQNLGYLLRGTQYCGVCIRIP